MLARIDKTKIVMAFGLVALVGSLAVLGAAVIRVRNLQTTVTQPKAFDEVKYAPECTKEPACCSGDPVKDCPWAGENSRGWCHPNHCPAKGGERCGLLFINYCLNKGYCEKDSDCTSGWGQTCEPTKHVCVVDQGGNPCWNPQPIPTNGTVNGLSDGKISFSWSWNTQWSSALDHAVLYLSDDPNISHVVGATEVKSLTSTTVTLAQLGVTSLQQDKQYWWKVNANSYSPPAGVNRNCMPTWSFVASDVTPQSCFAPKPDLCGTSCTDKKTDANNCGSCDKKCATGESCTNGVCGGTAAKTHLACSNNACTRVDGAGNNTDGCTTEGAACTGSTCTSNAQCPSGKICSSVTKKCYDPDKTHLSCLDNTCSRVDGAGTNVGCSTEGADCTSTTNEVNACWGNNGSNGRCYDCNGDGTVNALDFSCLRNVYNQSIN